MANVHLQQEAESSPYAPSLQVVRLPGQGWQEGQVKGGGTSRSESNVLPHFIVSGVWLLKTAAAVAAAAAAADKKTRSRKQQPGSFVNVT